MRDIGPVLDSEHAEHALEFERWSRELLDSIDELESRELSDADILGETDDFSDFELEVL